ncbi:MAG: D-tyrosyl-tRNA(Tyr) deacylase [Lutibacter sp.]|uniref:D-aminoacyl-tRNA deacylase n=1 Tax=Lutibacter sp. TaxID=1925666 RepID=UPI0019FA3C5C|nr:D-aminoacyl-tRNA deacylase [Lutibacter sp.]NOR29375.1 D-tyrosyl-tRNA(Tyr) deacylase [Lutibacter sp.]
MKAVIQRVSEASVTVNGVVVSEIGNGLLILLGIEAEDTTDDIEWLSNKIINLRIFNDENEVMNKSLLDEDGEAIIVSQFTLHASTKKGNRPSYMKAAKPEISIPLYQQFITAVEDKIHKKVGTGKFGAAMKVALINDGPVTIVIDSKKRE